MSQNASSTNLIEINSMKEFVEYTSKKNVVVDFYAKWCGPCVNFAPIYHEIAEKCALHKNLVFLKVNVDVLRDVADQCKISSLPTFAFFKDGKMVDRFSGSNELALLKSIQDNFSIKVS